MLMRIARWMVMWCLEGGWGGEGLGDREVEGLMQGRVGCSRGRSGGVAVVRLIGNVCLSEF